MTLNSFKLGALVLLIAAAMGGTAFAHGGAHDYVAGDNPLADKVREANGRFADVNVALKEGYAPIPCVSGIEGGAMGIHYVNGDLINDDGAIEMGKPEAVMYEPGPNGEMTLVAVEYISLKGRPTSAGTCSPSRASPTAMACRRSTSCMSGPGAPTRPARSRT